MTIKKSPEITAYLYAKNIDRGKLGITYYTEDKNTVFLNIRVREENNYFNFSNSNLTPTVVIKCQDDSIFTLKEEIKFTDREKGLFTIPLSEQIIKHIGLTEFNIFLTEDNKSIHLINFQIEIVNSKLEEVVEKEVEITLIDDKIRNFIIENSELLKGSDGMSAYQIAVANGFVGNEQEWLDSLNAKNSENNTVQEDMTYEKALELGMASWVDENSFNAAAEEKRQHWNEEQMSAIMYGDSFYTTEELMFSRISNISRNVADFNKITNAINYGYLPILQGQPLQDFTSFQTEQENNGVYGSTLLDYLFSKVPKGVNNSTSKLNGKNITIIGDSITEENFRTSKNYHQFIAERTGVTFNNLGISGTGYASRVSVVNDIKTTPDAFLIFLGTNDYGQVYTNLPLGTVSTKDYTNVAGQIYNMLNSLTKKFPYTPVLLMTPLPRIECHPLNEVRNKAGYTLGELSDLIIEFGNMFGMPVLDLYRNSNLRPYIDSNNKKFFAFKEGGEDGLHPNTEGHEFISYQIESFLENHSIVGQKRVYTPPSPEVVDNGDGTFSVSLIPDDIFWTTETSFAMNISPYGNFDVANVNIKSIEVNEVVVPTPTTVPPKLLYWYTLPTFEEGSVYNKTNIVKPLHDVLTISSYDKTEKKYRYLVEPIKITYSLK